MPVVNYEGRAIGDGRPGPLSRRSDATSDVAHVWKGRFFRRMDHVERFQASMAGLRMSLPLTARGLFEGMTRRTAMEIAVTRGPSVADPETGSGHDRRGLGALAGGVL